MDATSKQVKDRIFDFAYEMAMRDATLRTAVLKTDNHTAIEDDGISRIRRLSMQEDAKNAVKRYIDAIFERKEIPCFYDAESEVEKSLNQYLEKHWHNQAEFTFGNAQKLINMTAKYMFIACYNESSLRECFRNCHCPMDNVIIEHIINDIEKANLESFVSGLAEKYMKEDGIYTPRRTWKGYLKQSWSNIRAANKGQYMFFQELVHFLGEKDNLSPLEYDLCFWGIDD